MAHNIYDEILIEHLENNPHVKRVSKKSISFYPEFKLKTVIGYEEGKKPEQVFSEHGFNLALIDKDYPRDCLKRWKQLYKKFGAERLLADRRGKRKT